MVTPFLQVRKGNPPKPSVLAPMSVCLFWTEIYYLKKGTLTRLMTHPSRLGEADRTGLEPGNRLNPLVNSRSIWETY